LEKAPTASGELGLRELNRLQTRKRLRDAAAEVFARRGYNAATTREIAEVAELAQSTLFRHVPDKAELLFLVMNEALDVALETGRRAASQMSGATVAVRLAAFYRPRYQLLADWVELGRQFVRESAITITDREAVGPETLRSRLRRQTVQDAVAEILDECVRAGVLDNATPISDCSRMINSLYLMEIRHFLNETTPDEAKGIAMLEKMFSIALKGFTAQNAHR